MKVSDSLDSALSAFLTHPAAILPAYLIGRSVGTVARTIPLVGLFCTYLWLRAQGRLAAFGNALRGIDPATVPDDPAAVDSGTLPVDQLNAAMDALLGPGVVALAGGSILLGVLVFVLVEAVVGAGQIHTVYAALQGRTPLVAGVSGAIRDARPFVGLRLFEYGLYLLVTVIYGLVVFVAASVYVAAGEVGLLAAGIAALLAPVWLLAVLAIAAVFVFAPQAVVVDDRRTVGGLKAGARFIRRRPGAFVVYVVIAIGISGAVTAATAVLSFFGGPQIAGLLSVLVATPFLGLFKTGLYAGGERIEAVPILSGERRPVRDRLREAGRTTLSVFWVFTKRTPGLTALGLALFGVGTVGGYYATGGLTLTTPAPEDPTAVFGAFPIGTFTMIAANNWLVAVGQTYAGLALGIPTVVNLLFNGAVVGLIAGISANLAVVAALVVPHALIEVPALAISGALGLHLGGVAWRRAQDRIDDERVAGELRRAFWVLVGLAVAFVLAGFVEAFLTPRIAGWVLWL